MVQLPTVFGVKNAWPLSSMGWVAWLTVTARLLMLTLSLPKTNILCENPECPGFSVSLSQYDRPAHQEALSARRQGAGPRRPRRCPAATIGSPRGASGKGKQVTKEKFT